MDCRLFSKLQNSAIPSSKADCSVFTLSIGWLVDVTINFASKNNQ